MAHKRFSITDSTKPADPAKPVLFTVELGVKLTATPQRAAIRRAGDKLTIMPAGATAAHPAETLTARDLVFQTGTTAMSLDTTFLADASAEMNVQLTKEGVNDLLVIG